MNNKDLQSLTESYQKVLENTLADMVGVDTNDLESDVSGVEPEIDKTEHVDNFINDAEAKNMFVANLAAIRSRAHEILKLIENDKEVDAWMTDKIAVAANDLKDVCDAIEFRY
jgi:hypothetical protein